MSKATKATNIFMGKIMKALSTLSDEDKDKIFKFIQELKKEQKEDADEKWKALGKSPNIEGAARNCPRCNNKTYYYDNTIKAGRCSRFECQYREGDIIILEKTKEKDNANN